MPAGALTCRSGADEGVCPHDNGRKILAQGQLEPKDDPQPSISPLPPCDVSHEDLREFTTIAAFPFVVGLELERQVIGEELDYAASGRAAIKCVNGDYGAGKSFLSRLAMEMAAERGFVCSFVTISVDTPLDKLGVVYRDLAANLRITGQQAALKGLVDRWVCRIEEKLIDIEGIGEDDPALRDRTSDVVIEAMADRVTGKLGGRVDVVPRLFLREFVDVLDRVQQHPDYDPRKHYELDLESVKSAMELAPQEEEALREGEGFEEAPIIE